MAFRVILADPAFLDVEDAVDFIRADSPVNARQWLADFWMAVATLKEFPFRHALIPEAESIGIPYRSLFVHAHRLIFRVDEERATVYVVRVCHGARKPLNLEDV